jgi:hypothetical protein
MTYVAREPNINVGYFVGKLWLAFFTAFPGMWWGFRNQWFYYNRPCVKKNFTVQNYLPFFFLLGLWIMLLPTAALAIRGTPWPFIVVFGLLYIQSFFGRLLLYVDGYFNDRRMGIHPI